MADDHDHGHDVHFESADAGASLTYPQQAGTVRKNAFLVIKGRACKVWLHKCLCRHSVAKAITAELLQPPLACQTGMESMRLRS